MKVVVDSREQRPLWEEGVVVKKLDVGDYSLLNFEDKIAIERKSLIDLYGTLGRGHKRFKKELERSEALDYFAIVIEGTYTQCVTKSFPGSFHSKIRGYVITSILFTLHVKYGVNVFFAKDRKESREIIKELFKAYLKIHTKEDISLNTHTP